MTERVRGLGMAIIFSLGCASGAPVSAQNSAAPTVELQSTYTRVHRAYLNELDRIRKTLGSVGPRLITAFDQRNKSWANYVASECDTSVDRLYHGGTAVPNLGLQCKIAFEEVRTEILRRNYAAIQH